MWTKFRSGVGLKAVSSVCQSRLWLLVSLTYLTWRCRCPSHRKALGQACPWGDCGLEKRRGEVEREWVDWFKGKGKGIKREDRRKQSSKVDGWHEETERRDRRKWMRWRKKGKQETWKEMRGMKEKKTTSRNRKCGQQNGGPGMLRMILSPPCALLYHK